MTTVPAAVDVEVAMEPLPKVLQRRAIYFPYRVMKRTRYKAAMPAAGMTKSESESESTGTFQLAPPRTTSDAGYVLNYQYDNAWITILTFLKTVADAYGAVHIRCNTITITKKKFSRKAPWTAEGRSTVSMPLEF